MIGRGRRGRLSVAQHFMQGKGGEEALPHRRGHARRVKILASAICISPDRARCHLKFQRKVNFECVLLSLSWFRNVPVNLKTRWRCRDS